MTMEMTFSAIDATLLRANKSWRACSIQSLPVVEEERSLDAGTQVCRKFE